MSKGAQHGVGRLGCPWSLQLLPPSPSLPEWLLRLCTARGHHAGGPSGGQPRPAACPALSLPQAFSPPCWYSGEKKKHGWLVSSTLRFKYFNPSLRPFQIARGRPCVLSQRELALASGNTQPLTGRLSPAANFSEPWFPCLNLGLITTPLTPELRLVQPANVDAL